MGGAPACEPPFVSVVIAVYNDLEGLRRCLGALEGQTYPCGSYEVVVVDNGSSTPIGPALTRFPHVVPREEGKRGSYAARNRGIEASRGDIFAFTDADCLPAADWLAEGVAALEADPACGLVAGNVRIFARDALAPTSVEQYELLFGFPQAHYVSVGFGATANLFTRREVFERVGRFRAELQSGGDREWGLRVKAAGYGLFYLESARVDHPARRSWRELVKKTTRTNRGMFELARMQGRGRLYTLRLVVADLKPPIGWIVQVLRGRELPSLRARLSVIAVLLFNRWLRAFLWLSMEAGSRRTGVDKKGQPL